MALPAENVDWIWLASLREQQLINELITCSPVEPGATQIMQGNKIWRSNPYSPARDPEARRILQKQTHTTLSRHGRRYNGRRHLPRTAGRCLYHQVGNISEVARFLPVHKPETIPFSGNWWTPIRSDKLRQPFSPRQTTWRCWLAQDAISLREITSWLFVSKIKISLKAQGDSNSLTTFQNRLSASACRPVTYKAAPSRRCRW